MIVVLDACVLYPASLRDLLLTVAALDAFDIRWSEEILEELRRSVVRDHPSVDPGRFASHTLAAMRSAFPEAMSPVDAVVAKALDNDPKDRHVAAVAVTSRADAIVTLNVKDFGGKVLRGAEIAVLTPGKLVGRVLDESPEVVVLAIWHLADRWTNPPRTPREIADDMIKHPTLGAPMKRVRRLLPDR